jgi:hypothetical protein
MRTLSRWFRVVTPPWWVFVIYLGFVTLLTIASVADRSSRNGMLLFVGLGPAAYGAYRAMYFHPANRNHYRSWLETTPWRHPKPLPFGPVSLVWQDVPVLVAFGVVGMLQHLIVAGLTLSSPQLLPASHVVSILVYVIAIPFFSLYAICVALTIAGTGQSNVAWLMGVGFGVLCRVIAEPWLALVAAFATVVVGHWGVQRSLASYHGPKSSSLVAALLRRGRGPSNNRIWDGRTCNLGPIEKVVPISYESCRVAAFRLACSSGGGFMRFCHISNMSGHLKEQKKYTATSGTAVMASLPFWRLVDCSSIV